MKKAISSFFFSILLLPAMLYADDVKITARAQVEDHARKLIDALTVNLRSVDVASLVIVYDNLDAITNENQRRQVRSLVTKALADQDRYEPFAANLDTAAELTDTGNGNVPSATGSLQTQAKGMISWESAHFGDSHTFDFSFGGHFGYAPVLTLVDLTSSGTALAPNARPMFQQGFVWSIRPQVNWHLGEFHDGQLSSELAIFGGVGETILTSTVSSFKQSDKTINATTVANNVTNSAPFVETGVQFRLYNADFKTVHRLKAYLAPSFFVESGVKFDNRFKAEGELAGYDSPRNRTFIRFLVSLNKVTNLVGTNDPKQPFSVDFGVDHEMPMVDRRVPPSTRIIIRGSLDVLKLLKGTS